MMWDIINIGYNCLGICIKFIKEIYYYKGI